MRCFINIDELRKELQERDMSILYHANSVETSLTYLEYGALLPRGKCDRESLPQSFQFTDEKDRKYDIWNDIFLNFSDFHRVFKRPNSYGPVLFCLNKEKVFEFILKNMISLSITSKQPHNWQDDDTDESRWRGSIIDLFKYPKNHFNKRYVNGWPDIVLFNCDLGLPLNLIDKIIIDGHPENSLFFVKLRSQINHFFLAKNIQIKIYERNRCEFSCGCKSGEIEKKYLEKFELGAWKGKYQDIAA